MKASIHEKSSIETILYRYFFIIAISVSVVLTALFSFMQYRTLRSHALEELERYCNSIRENLDLQINEMDTILLSAISSTAMLRSFSKYMETDPENINGFYNAGRELETILQLDRGFDYSIRQLNVYAMKSGGYGVGAFNGSLPFTVEAQSWYDDALAAKGFRVVPYPALDLLSSQGSGASRNQYYISVCRMFFNNANVPSGFIEVKKYYDDFFTLPKEAYESRNMSVYIYDKDLNRVYPIPSDDTPVYYYPTVNAHGTVQIKNTVTGKREYVCFSDSDDYLIATVVETGNFMAPIYGLLSYFLVIALLVFILCLILTRVLSARLSDPIRRIYHFLSDENKEQFALISLPDTNIREIDKLRDSLNEDIKSRKSATSSLMILKEQEIQAQMLALQSQMNPHFLYNSLSTIAEMADEGLTAPVSTMCRDITSILRYISSNAEARTTLEEELENCDLYLGCMKLRYGEDLSYTFKVNDELLDFQVPKLCLQLLIENAVKSVTTQKPPWEIEVEGHMDDKAWYLTVKDNGPGFSGEADSHLRAEMDKILDKGLLPSLRIEGMGILNIFIRLYLEDGIPFVFDFGNSPRGGAFVTIGGYFKDERA